MIKRVFYVVFGLMFFSMVSVVKAQESPVIVNRSTTIHEIDGEEYFFHAVLQEQTLYSIARAYSVSEDDIRRANPELQHQELRYDQMIRVPVARHQPAPNELQSKTVTKVTYITHQVKRRETVYGIARQYQISQTELIEHNPDIRKGLRPNMVLQIPQERPSTVHYVEYVAPPGQTLFSLSREFGVTIEDIESLNPELEDGLKAGQTIKIPVDVSPPLPPPFVYDPDEHEKKLYPQPVTEPEDPYCQDPQQKDHYNVALLIPLFLEKFDQETLRSQGRQHPSFTFMEYYEGIRIALDSVRARGADIRLSVFDVCDSVPKVREVLNNPAMSQMDLIIGPFYPATFGMAADFAKQRNIPIIYPLHWDQKQLLSQYPNMFLATPHIQTQMNDMANFIVEHYPDKNIVLVHNNQPGVLSYIKGYKETLNNGLNYRKFFQDSVNLARMDDYFLNRGVYVGERITNVYVLNDSLLLARQLEHEDRGLSKDSYLRRDNIQENVFSQQGMEVLKTQLDSTSRNVVVALMGGEALISDLTRQLNNVRDTFEVVLFGVPQWRDYRAVDSRYLHNLRAHIFSTDYIDYQKKYNNDFIRRYREHNHTEPGTTAFKAVQTGMFFFTALMQYGPEFYRCMNHINRQKSASSPFWFHRPYQNGGWENKHVDIFTYQNFELVNARETKQEVAEEPQK